MSIDKDFFLETVRPLFHGGLSSSQRQGVTGIFDCWDALGGADLRWLAYMLATSFHETNQQMKAVREAYWLSENWRRSHLPYYPYYGRGHVQLTHRENYKKAGDYFHVDLVGDPDLALRDDYSSKIMFVGMRDGWFRKDGAGAPHTLGRYFSSDADDPVGARKIVNGREPRLVGGRETTVAEIIASYYDVFRRSLKQRAPAIAAAPEKPAELAFTGNAAVVNLVAESTLTPVSASSQSARESSILLALAESIGLQSPMTELIQFSEASRPSSHPQHWAIIDFNKPSYLERLHLFDIETESVKSYLCAHGRGSEGESDDGIADVFSNRDGSNASSLGIYLCNETYYGQNGYSLRLDGLQPSNSNARHRAIVIHGADYVSPEAIEKHGRIGRSFGCPAVERRFAAEIIDALKRGSLLYAWKS
jgi:hypothetical protein